MGRILLGIVVVLAVAIGVAARFLPWWGVGLVVVGLAFAGKYAAGVLMKRFFLGLLKAKSGALSGATAQLRSVTTVPPLPAEEYWDEEERRAAAAQRWFAVEVAIAPGADAGGFTHWEPGELVFTRPGKSVEDDDHEAADVRKVEIFTDGAFREDEGGEKVEGPQTLRLTIGVHAGVSKATLRYYFEELATVDFGAPRSR
jgi:hypothetical protein